VSAFFDRVMEGGPAADWVEEFERIRAALGRELIAGTLPEGTTVKVDTISRTTSGWVVEFQVRIPRDEEAMSAWA
jgi:hypothetical protein